MSLYTSVYWTKRVLVVVGVVLFACSGIKIFQVISSNLTQTQTIEPPPKPELGFGLLDRVTFTPTFDPPVGFVPTEFINNTLNGNFDADNGYPLQNTVSPIANVYKIQDKPIDINSTEIPNRIAKALNFTGEAVSGEWKDRDRSLQIDGQYLLIKYRNNRLNTSPSNGIALDFSQTDSLKRFYQNTLSDLGIDTNFTGYIFNFEYLNYDTSKNDFVASGKVAGNFIRINAIRNYPNIVKNREVFGTAVYPGYAYSNNYLIVPTRLPQNYKTPDILAGLSLYNWPINQALAVTNKDVQTYNIKTPKQAYDELVKNNKYLMSVRQWDTHQYVDPKELDGVDRVTIFRIRLQMYEDTVNTEFIQPIYVFECQAEKNGRLIELIYYVSAVTNVVQ